MVSISEVHALTIAKVRAQPGLESKVYVAEADEGDPRPLPFPHVMIFADNGQYTSDQLIQHGEKVYFNYTVHLVGETHEQINWLADKFYAAWNNWRPEFETARCFKMKPNFSTPDNTNDSLHPPFLYRVDEWGFYLVGRT